MTRNPANTIKALGPYLTDITVRLPRAVRNLDEIQPGFPSSTPGSGDVGGGGTFGSGGRTERLALSEDVVTDKAYVDRHAVDRCVDLIKAEVLRLHLLVTNYDYAVAGENQAGTNPRVAPSTINDRAEPGCVSCGRAEVLIWSSIYQDDRCRWCYDFKRSEGFDPTPTLLEMHDAGKRMSRAVVDAEMKPLREAAKKRAAVKPSKRKKGKTTSNLNA